MVLFFHSLLLLLLRPIVSFSSVPDSTSGSSKNIYPPCPLYGDTFGKWIRTNEIKPSFGLELSRHFSLREPGEAFAFNEIWIPQNCSYHRFTNETIFQMVHQKLRKNGKKNQIHIGIFGDSGTRGIFCGLFRIISGSERFGSCNNLICGDENHMEITMENAPYQLHDVEFYDGLFKVTFAYITRLEKVSINLMEKFLNLYSADVMLLNTGAWDFDHLARTNQHDPEKQFCDTDEAVHVSQSRSSLEVVKAFHKLAISARKFETRLIYRNNHYNQRYSAECADLLLETNLRELQKKEAVMNSSFTKWEIWDNRRISKGIYLNQCWDGFHYDRPRRTDSDRWRRMSQFFQQNGEVPETMLMQFAQSFLNSLFHKEIIEEYQRIYHLEGIDLTSLEEVQIEEVNQTGNDPPIASAAAPPRSVALRKQQQKELSVKSSSQLRKQPKEMKNMRGDLRPRTSRVGVNR
jgi:hypothetical protein